MKKESVGTGSTKNEKRTITQIFQTLKMYDKSLKMEYFQKYEIL